MTPPAGSVRELRVLIVERDQLPREAMAAALALDPATVCAQAADDSDAALHDVDVVLLVARVPGIDVTRAVYRLRCTSPAARVVVLVGYPDEVVVASVLAAGAHAVLDTTTSLDSCLDALHGRALPDVEPTMSRTTVHDRYAHRRALELGLTDRQYEVLRLIGAGLNPDQAARKLGIKLSTARDHVKAMRAAMDVTSVPELIVVSARLGLLPELLRPVR